MKNKGLNTVLGLFALCVLAASNAHAAGPKDFTNTDLMSFTVDQRHAYYTGSMISMSHAISMYDKEKGQCFSDWFFEDVNKRIMEIEEDIKKHPDHVPSMTMLVLPQIKCGKIKKAKE